MLVVSEDKLEDIVRQVVKEEIVTALETYARGLIMGEQQSNIISAVKRLKDEYV